MALITTLLLGAVGAVAGYAGSGRIADYMGLPAGNSGRDRLLRNLIRIGAAVGCAFYPAAAIGVAGVPLAVDTYNYVSKNRKEKKEREAASKEKNPYREMIDRFLSRKPGLSNGIGEVLVDKKRQRQVLKNMLSNARQVSKHLGPM